jgi:hypothetical protein
VVAVIPGGASSQGTGSQTRRMWSSKCEYSAAEKEVSK